MLERVFEREGISFVRGRALTARREGGTIVITTAQGEARGELLLIASGRKPSVDGLYLEKAGVAYTDKGIKVDGHLRTTTKNIYAAGDVIGSYQYSHYAGWQAFQAVRNALLPARSSGVSDLVPRVTFTAPEVAHVGLTEEQAKRELAGRVQVRRWMLSQIDRAVCENDRDGFLKIITQPDGTILGATLVSERAGESISELALAMKQKQKIINIATTMHPYPTYSSGIQLLAAEAALQRLLSGLSGRIIRGLAALAR